jgi:hypothetical protein
MVPKEQMADRLTDDVEESGRLGRFASQEQSEDDIVRCSTSSGAIFERKSTMKEFRSFLWDTTTYFVTGVLILLNMIYYNQLDLIRAYINIDILSGELIKGIYLIIITYTIGVIYEPAANVVFRQLIRAYAKLPWNKKIESLRKERDDVYMPIVKNIIQSKYHLEAGADYFHIAKAYLYRTGIPELHVTFLSRFGLYRNLTVLILGNAFITVWVNRYNLLSSGFLLAFILLMIVHQLLFFRARQFYFYTGNEICRHFILSHKDDA